MKYFYIKLQLILSDIVKMLSCLLILSVATTPVYGQILTDFPCYAVSEDNKAPNQLFTYIVETDVWIAASNPTGTSNIEAIATDPINNIIYATDGGTFGTIDATTGIFTAIGEVGYGNGDMGNILLDDIDGLTYDPVNRLMYATQRIEGTGSGTEDLLFKIDVATGTIASGAMIDKTGMPSDYAEIPFVFDSTFAKSTNENNYSKRNKNIQTEDKNTSIAQFEIYDVDDIAYNPYTGELYALHSGDFTTVISLLNKENAVIEQIVFDIGNNELEGIGFSYLGELYGTTGNNGICDPNDPNDLSCNNIFMFIDLIGQSTTDLTMIDPTGASRDFESFDCLTAFNDLALQMFLDAETPPTVNSGDTLTFQITVFNQGDFANNNIKITNYIPAGLTLIDDNWNLVETPAWQQEDNIATRILPELLESGASITIPITFIVDANFSGEIANTAEISASFSPDITDNFGNIIRLPDFDSQPNDQNDEDNFFVVNNEINQGGPNANADEDDHDIELLTVEALIDFCPPSLTIANSSTFQNKYQSSGNINTIGFVLIEENQQVEYTASNITLNMGFEVETGASFYANSGSCN